MNTQQWLAQQQQKNVQQILPKEDIEFRSSPYFVWKGGSGEQRLYQVFPLQGIDIHQTDITVWN